MDKLNELELSLQAKKDGYCQGCGWVDGDGVNIEIKMWEYEVDYDVG